MIFALLLAVPVLWGELPAAIQRQLPVGQAGFRAYLNEMEADTRRRVAEGEMEHLVYFVLQSKSFTTQPVVEPALSRESPDVVRLRFQDYLSGRTVTPTLRLQYFRAHLSPTEPEMRRTYEKAMDFLEHMDYAGRGHSSDTSLAASFTVWNAINVMKALNPKIDVRRVLIIGPGADFAPRTSLDETNPPQSYQPYAVAAALGEGVAVDCADVNERVLATISNRKPVFPQEAGTEEFLGYQRSLSASAVQARISPVRLNIVTERLDRKYDLIVATNVLLYFPPAHLALALANIEGMLNPGGYFIHNDTRAESGLDAAELGLSTVQARRILIAQGRKAPLYDVFGLLRKSPRK